MWLPRQLLLLNTNNSNSNSVAAAAQSSDSSSSLDGVAAARTAEGVVEGVATGDAVVSEVLVG